MKLSLPNSIHEYILFQFTSLLKLLSSTHPFSSIIFSTPILKSSLLVKAPPFDEEAINLEFQAEYDALEQRSRQLDLNFQNLLKDLRIWISASIEPITDEAKIKLLL